MCISVTPFRVFDEETLENEINKSVISLANSSPIINVVITNEPNNRKIKVV